MLHTEAQAHEDDDGKLCAVDVEVCLALYSRDELCARRQRDDRGRADADFFFLARYCHQQRSQRWQ